MRGTRYVLLLVMLNAGAVAIPRPLGASASGPVPASTGGFGEMTCQQCHRDNPLNGPEGALALSGIPDTYVTGQRYSITVSSPIPRSSTLVSSSQPVSTAARAPGPSAPSTNGSKRYPTRVRRSSTSSTRQPGPHRPRSPPHTGPSSGRRRPHANAWCFMPQRMRPTGTTLRSATISSPLRPRPNPSNADLLPTAWLATTRPCPSVHPWSHLQPGGIGTEPPNCRLPHGLGWDAEDQSWVDIGRQPG